MARTGMYRCGNERAQVEYDGSSIPISRTKYEENGYKPDFYKLPLEADYWAAQEAQEEEKARNAPSK
jgi:hypothetical protein